MENHIKISLYLFEVIALNHSSFEMEDAVDVLKAIGEPTRMRLLILLSQSDLTVSDLTDILGQSQPRISRHLKLLADAGLIERYQEGAWAYFRSIKEGRNANLLRQIIEGLSRDDKILSHDHERLVSVKETRAAKAQEYFSLNAESWEEIRRHHVPEERVEKELCNIIGSAPINSLLDLGTGTGRILELLQGQYRRGLGVDASHRMLTIARDKLDKAGITHASVRQGDIFNLSFERQSFDLIIIHQVLHFLYDPAPAIKEATKMLSPGGRMVVIDFAPHDLDYLRSDFAHARLGFPHETVAEWMKSQGLDVEKISDLTPQNEQDQKLTVTIWMGKDPRLLIAEQSESGLARV